MGFLNKIFRRHKDDFSFEDEPITGYDPAASTSKVNDYLSSNSSDDPMAQSYATDSGLPPSDSGLPPETQTHGVESLFDDPAKTSAQMNGMTGQDMAKHYTKQQEYMQNQTSQPQNQNSNPSKEEEIINLKLDSMKNQLDAINQRIQRIEQLLSNPPKKW